MATFAYQARDAKGELNAGTLVAQTLAEAAAMLRKQGRFVIKLKETKTAENDEFTGTAQVSASALARAAKQVKRKEVIFFAHQLSVMVETGVPISEALQCTTDQIENRNFEMVLRDITEKVESGQDLSAALAHYPKVFPTVMRSLIRAGELSGTMPQLLQRCAEYLTSEYKTKAKLRSALTYPGIMLAIAVTVTVFLLAFVLPRFTAIYSTRGAALPPPTRLLMAMSSAVTDYWVAWLVGLTAMGVGLHLGLKTRTGRRTMDWVKLNAPVFRNLFRQAYLARSCRTLGTMINAGVSMLDTVAIVKAVVPNTLFAELWDKVDDQLRRGSQLSDAFFDSELIPASVSQMVRSGEKSGRLGPVLDRVADFSENEFDEAVTTGTQMIEPVMIVFMGCLVGFVAISLLLPIFSVGRVASGG